MLRLLHFNSLSPRNFYLLRIEKLSHILLITELFVDFDFSHDFLQCVIYEFFLSIWMLDVTFHNIQYGFILNNYVYFLVSLKFGS